MLRKLSIGVSAAAVVVLGMTGVAGAASGPPPPIQLALSQGDAFAVLGHDCGSIGEKAYATGFDSTIDPAAGYPTGDIFLTTTCGGSGRGGGGGSTTYTAWTGETWDLTGALLSYSALSGSPTVDPSFSATDPLTGNQVYDSTSNLCQYPGGTGFASACLQLAAGFTPRPRVTGISPMIGAAGGGASVTLYGDAFTAATAVYFGTTPAASFTINGDTSITAVTPVENPGLVDVTVVSPGGASLTSSNDQYTVYGQPAVTGVSPNSGPAGGDYTITVTGTNFTGTTGVTFGDTPGGFTVVNDTTLSVFVPPTDSPGDNVDITVTSPGGTSPTTPADQFTYNLLARVAISPIKGVPATAVKVTGAHFAGGETVTVRYWTGLSAPKPATVKICSGVATPTGTFVCKGKIPGATSAGVHGIHFIVATGSTGDSASTSFDLT